MAVMLQDKVLPPPVLQGGVGVSLDRLAGAVAACGGNAGNVNTISTVREQIVREWRNAG